MISVGVFLVAQSHPDTSAHPQTLLLRYLVLTRQSVSVCSTDLHVNFRYSIQHASNTRTRFCSAHLSLCLSLVVLRLPVLKKEPLAFTLKTSEDKTHPQQPSAKSCFLATVTPLFPSAQNNAHTQQEFYSVLLLQCCSRLKSG